MDFVRRLVGSKPTRKRQPPTPIPRPDMSLNRSADEATVYRPVPKIEPEPQAEADALGSSATRGRPDQLTMMGTAPLARATRLQARAMSQ